jgi:hypothetical protein
VPEEGVAAEVGASASAEVAGMVVGELGRSAEVGVRSEVGVSAVVRGGRVGSVVVSLGDSVPLGDSVALGMGRVPDRSVVGRVAESLPPPAPQPLSPRPRPATSPASSQAVIAGASRRDGIGRGRRGSLPGRRRRSFFGSACPPASPEAGENAG